MKTVFYLDGKKISRAKLKDMIGEDRLKSYVRQAKEGFKADPNELQSWFIGYGILAICFE